MKRDTVDSVVKIPDSWFKLSSRRRLKFFMPEWDDLVDPDFDFETDTHSGGAGDWSNEVYAHQMFEVPSYDGILVSRVVYERTRKKKTRIDTLGIHRFLRIPDKFPVMGDCGAFGYINMETPPYTTPEVMDYYSRLGFNYGVSIDHLIVTGTYAQKHSRYELTLDNAADMFRLHGSDRCWTPIGAIQGWDPESYASAARAVARMGYKYIGIGGLVRTRTEQVLQIVRAARAEVPSDVKFHLFGLARLNAVPQMIELGVESVDSAAPLRRAWFGTGQNYLSANGEWYAAVRIPGAGSFRAKRMVRDGRATEATVKRLEKECLERIRGYAKGEVTVEETIAVIDEFDRLITPNRPVNTTALQRTLEDRPWESCSCDVCREAGVDIIIFRGNNRNRRRGFHNTYVFRQLLNQKLAIAEAVPSRE